MRKINYGLEDVKNKIRTLKGKEIEMNINRGRKKIDTLTCVIQDVYPSVFTVISTSPDGALQTFSYFDVLCGNVIIMNN